MSIQRIPLFAALLCLLSLQACSSSPTDPQEYLAQATEHTKNKEYAKGIEALDKFLKVYPDNAQVYGKRGVCNQRLGKDVEAVADFTKVIELGTHLESTRLAYILRGQIHLNNKRFDQALADSNKRIEMTPEDSMAHYSRGSLLMQMNRYSSAIPYLDRAIVLKPDYAMSYYARGISYFLTGRNDAALEDINTSIALDPAFPGSYMSRAEIYTKMGEGELAAADSDKFRKLSAN